MVHLTGLFAGIGGIEQGFHNALGSKVETDLLCESWAPAQIVLKNRFPGAELHPDVRELASLPEATDILSAGFPCQDLTGRSNCGHSRGAVRVGDAFVRAASASHLCWTTTSHTAH